MPEPNPTQHYAASRAAAEPTATSGVTALKSRLTRLDLLVRHLHTGPHLLGGCQVGEEVLERFALKGVLEAPHKIPGKPAWRPRQLAAPV